MPITVVTSNLLSTNLIGDICEADVEVAVRYNAAIQFYESRLASDADIILVQEADSLFVYMLQKHKDLTYIIHDMSPPYKPGAPPAAQHNRKYLVIFYKATIQLIADHTPYLTQQYQSIHGPYPLRAQLAVFQRGNGEKYIIGNVHGSGQQPKLLQDILGLILPYIPADVGSTIIGGDMYATPTAQAATFGFSVLESRHPTAQHNFTVSTEDGTVKKAWSLSNPDVFIYRDAVHTYLSVQPRMDQVEYPYQYLIRCGDGTYTLEDLEQCRMHGRPPVALNKEVNLPAHINRRCRRYARHVQAKYNGWFSDHAAVTAVFRK